MINSNQTGKKVGIHELPHELPDNLRLRIRILGKWEIQENLKTARNYSLVPTVFFLNLTFSH